MTEQIKGDLGGLKGQILSQAKERCREIIAQSKEQVEKILAEAKRRGQEDATEILRQAYAQAQERQRQMLLNSELQRRKQNLQAQREALQQAFSQAVASFAQLPKAEYQEFIRSLLIESKERSCDQIVVSPAEERITPEFIAQVAKELDWKLQLVREEDPRLREGGFLLRGERLEMDSSIPTILGLIRPQLEGDVAQILFGEL